MAKQSVPKVIRQVRRLTDRLMTASTRPLPNLSEIPTNSEAAQSVLLEIFTWAKSVSLIKGPVLGKTRDNSIVGQFASYRFGSTIEDATAQNYLGEMPSHLSSKINVDHIRSILKENNSDLVGDWASNRDTLANECRRVRSDVESIVAWIDERLTAFLTSLQPEEYQELHSAELTEIEPNRWDLLANDVSCLDRKHWTEGGSLSVAQLVFQGKGKPVTYDSMESTLLTRGAIRDCARRFTRDYGFIFESPKGETYIRVKTTNAKVISLSV